MTFSRGSGVQEVAMGYFERLRAQSPTRVWVNNPTAAEVGLALAQGAEGCTTNPAYAANLIRRAPDEVVPAIAACFEDRLSDAEIADRVQLELVATLATRFWPIYEATGGTAGFVSIQGSPLTDDDAARIIAEGRIAHRRAPNIAIKVPATLAGLAALETLVAEGAPTIVTEVFSVAQFIEACERYLRAAEWATQRPAFFISPITGIFGDYLRGLIRRDGLDVPARELEIAGVALAQACHQLAVERRYPVRLLCGGARTLIDLTGLVGADLSVTINWSTFAEILAAEPGPAASIDGQSESATIRMLTSIFPDLERALRPDGLLLDEFAAFGPVLHFRAIFEAGWRDLLQEIEAHRRSVAAGAGDTRDAAAETRAAWGTSATAFES
jgi:transaldolase